MSTTSTTSANTLPGGTWTIGEPTGADALALTRFGYGAMQLAGPWVMGPPADHDGALAVLHAAARAGITHIDTSDAYGPRITNDLIREALHPYTRPAQPAQPAQPEGQGQQGGRLHVVTKVGGTRDAQGGWPTARQPDQIRQQIQTNLDTLGLDVLDLVHLRMGDGQGTQLGSVAEPLAVLVDLQRQGVVRHIGLSNATADQIAEARSMASIVSVQNMYNLAVRGDDDLIDDLAANGIAYIPFFPLGGFSPLQSEALSTVATRLGATPMGVALAWLLQRSENILLIPGTKSATHLHENIAGAGLALSAADVAELNTIGR